MKHINIKDMRASQVAFGCMRIAGKSDAEAEEIINTALECGINYFDHADIYGGGESERVFARYLAAHPELRESIYVQSKCGIRPGRYDFSKEHILSAVDGILSRLNIEYLDALLLHRPDTLMEPCEVAEAFETLRNSGKVRRFGVSNHNPWQIELLKSAVKEELIINQLQFSVTEAGMVTSGMNVNMKNSDSVMHDGGLLEYSRLKGMTIQAWSPFQQGFFGGSFIGSDKYPKLNELLSSLAEKYSVTSTGIAAAWIMRHPANIQLISGSMNTQRIKEVCAGADVTLTREEWYDIYRAAGHTLP